MALEKNAGFILLHRSLREHWLWKDPVKFQWWVDILMECNHEDNQVLIKFELIDCKRGQTINSLLTWSKRWRVDVSTVRRYLYLCESDNMIVIENVQKTTRITVCNYDYYNSYQQIKQSSNNGKANVEHTPKQFSSNPDAIQTKNETKNERKKGADAPHTPEQQADFKKFVDWVTEHAPMVQKMREPFKIDQFLQLKNKFPVAKITSVLLAMHNWQPLVKKNRSAYLTATNWLKQPHRGEQAKTENTGAPPLKVLQ